MPIELTLDGCEALNEPELRALLIVEFDTLGVDRRGGAERVFVSCQGPRVAITLEDPSAALPPMQTALDLSATVPGVRSRLLALAISEIVVELRSRAVEPSPWAPPRAPEPPPTKGRAGGEGGAANDSSRPVRPFAAGSIRRVGHPGTWLVGVALGVELELFDHLRVASDARGEIGSTRMLLATVAWTAFSLAAELLVDVHAGSLDLAAGPGVRVARLSLDASPTTPGARGDRVDALWVGPLLAARGIQPFAERGFVYLSVEAGFVASPVLGRVNDGSELLDASGGWVLGTLGVGFSL